MSFSNLHTPSGETCMFWTSGKGDSPICGRLSRSSVVKTDLNLEFKMLSLPWLSVTVLLCVSGEIPLVLSCRFTLMVSPKLLVLFILWISEHTLSVGPIDSPDLLLHSFPERLEIIPVWNSINFVFFASLYNLAFFLTMRLRDGEIYSAFSPVFSTNVVCVKTQQKHARIKHHGRTKQ